MSLRIMAAETRWPMPLSILKDTLNDHSSVGVRYAMGSTKFGLDHGVGHPNIFWDRPQMPKTRRIERSRTPTK